MSEKNERLLNSAHEIYKWASAIVHYASLNSEHLLKSDIEEMAAVLERIDGFKPPLPCPFCGGNPKVLPDDFTIHGYWVKCSECGTEQGKPFDTREEAIEAWDRRVRHD